MVDSKWGGLALMLSVQAGMNLRNSLEHVTASTHTEVVGRKRTATLLSSTFNPDVFIIASSRY